MRGHWLWLGLLVAGCTGNIGDPPTAEVATDAPAVEPTGETEPTVLSPADASIYLSAIAPPLVGRVLDAEERALVEEEGGDAIPLVLAGWTTDERFPEAGRALIEKKLSVSGMRDGIDFRLPGNLAAHLVRSDGAWTGLLTSELCYGEDGEETPCDSGAPYNAGVLTTRGYLVSRASRFNLTRASTLLKAFACQNYPQAATLQPPIDKSRLIPMFQANTQDEQTVPEAANGFGNGAGCYTCHGQFSLHAQLFVRFDEEGIWQMDATGEQDPEGELGASFDGLMASHLSSPEEMALEHSQVFGIEVDNLAEAAQVIADSDVFYPCQVRNLLEYTLNLDASVDVDSELLERIALAARQVADSDPSFADLVVATFSDPGVIQSTLDSKPNEQP